MKNRVALAFAGLLFTCAVVAAIGPSSAQTPPPVPTVTAPPTPAPTPSHPPARLDVAPPSANVGAPVVLSLVIPVEVPGDAGVVVTFNFGDQTSANATVAAGPIVNASVYLPLAARALVQHTYGNPGVYSVTAVVNSGPHAGTYGARVIINSVATPVPTAFPTTAPKTPSPTAAPTQAPTPAPRPTPISSPTPQAGRSIVAPTAQPRSTVNVSSIQLNWPDGSHSLTLGGGAFVPEPIANVRVESTGRLTLQWLVDDHIVTTSTLDVTTPGMQRVTFPAALPPAGRHRVAVVQISNQVELFASPQPLQVVSYAFAPPPETVPDFYSGPIPVPKVTPIDAATIKIEKIQLTRPAWGHYVEGNGLLLKAGADRGIPAIDDALAFEWREKNPGTADRFVVRFLGKGGKELATVPVSARALAPDEALLKTLRTFAASGFASRGGRAAAAASEADVMWMVQGYKHIDSLNTDVLVENSDAWPLAGTVAATGLAPCDSPNAAAQPHYGSPSFVRGADGYVTLGGTLDLRSAPYAAPPVEYRAPAKDRKSSSVRSLAFDNVFVDWGDGTVEPIVASPRARNESFSQRGDLLDLDGGGRPMRHRYKSGGTYKARLFVIGESAAQDRSFKVDARAAMALACSNVVDPATDSKFHFIALDLTLVGASSKGKDRCAPWPSGNAKLTYSGAGDVDFIWKADGVEFARSRVTLNGKPPPPVGLPAKYYLGGNTPGTIVARSAALLALEGKGLAPASPAPANYTLGSPLLPAASFGKISVEVQDASASFTGVTLGATVQAEINADLLLGGGGSSANVAVKSASISSKTLSYATPVNASTESCTLIFKAKSGTFFINDAIIGYANDADKAANVKTATGTLGVFLLANADAKGGLEALNDNVLQYDVVVSGMKLPDGNITIVEGKLDGTPTQMAGNAVEQKILPVSVHADAVNAPLLMETRFVPSAADGYAMVPGESGFPTLKGEADPSGAYRATFSDPSANQPGVVLGKSIVVQSYSMLLEIGAIAPTDVRVADGSTCPNDPYIQVTLSKATALPVGFWANIAGTGDGAFILTGYGACGLAIPNQLNGANLGAATLSTTGLAYEAAGESYTAVVGNIDLVLNSPALEVTGKLLTYGGIDQTNISLVAYNGSDGSSVLVNLTEPGLVDAGGGALLLDAQTSIGAFGKDYPFVRFQTHERFDLANGGVVASSPAVLPNVGVKSANIPTSATVSAHDDEIEILMAGSTTSLGGPLQAVATSYDFGVHFDTGVSDPQIASTGAMSVAYPEASPQYTAQVQPGTVPAAGAPGLCFQLSESMIGSATIEGAFALSMSPQSNAYWAAYASVSGIDVEVIPGVIDLKGVAGGLAYHIAAPSGVFNTLAQAGACDATVMAEDPNQIGIIGKVDLSNPGDLFTIYGQMKYPDDQGNFRIDGLAWIVTSPSVDFTGIGDLNQYASSAPVTGFMTIGSGGFVGSLSFKSVSFAGAMGLADGTVALVVGGAHDLELSGSATVGLENLVTANGSFDFTLKPLAIGASVGVHKEIDLTIDDIGATFAADFAVGVGIQAKPIHIHAYSTADFSASLCFFHCWTVDLGGDLTFDAPPLSVGVYIHTPWGPVGVG